MSIYDARGQERVDFVANRPAGSLDWGNWNQGDWSQENWGRYVEYIANYRAPSNSSGGGGGSASTPSVRSPSSAGISQTKRDDPTLFIEGARNSEQKFGSVPVILGKHRFVPPLGAQPYTEVVGGDHYIRMLVIWGYGPLKIEDIKIGETALSEFVGVTEQTVEGRAGDDPITLFPDTVIQNSFSVVLKQAESWHTRTTSPNVDEISVDVTFPNGLTTFKTQGGRANRTVSFQIEYRKEGDATWLTPTFDAKTGGTVAGSTITITANKTSALRHGFTWSVATRGTYEVRLRRTTSDSVSDNISDLIEWTALRSITDEPPVSFDTPLAMTALRIKATDQLNRTVDELNGIVSSYVQEWDGANWAEAVSSNPAAIYRHVLQGPANVKAITDELIDLDRLQDWHEFCDTHGFEFNQIRDFEASVWETLFDVATVGRASPAQINSKWSVVYDYEQTTPKQHFTPRNSWGFQASKQFPEVPHGFRMRFIDRTEDWRQNERIVYADGYTEFSATVFEQIDTSGITDPEHIWKFGRFHLAQLMLRPERWVFNTDFEYLVAADDAALLRGDLVLITHDVLLVGLASGRIKEVQDNGTHATGFTSDEVLQMEAGKSYGVSVRGNSDAGITAQIVTDAGGQTTVVFSDPILLANAPVAGDLFGFGILGSETIQGLISSIEPAGELTAAITCIPASPAVYNSDTEDIPAFDSKLTALPVVPTAVIENVRSDESVLTLGSGSTLLPHIGVSIAPVDYPLPLTVDVQIRVNGTGENYANADFSVTGNDILIKGVEESQYYDIRVRWRDPDRLPPMWTERAAHRVVGQTNPPEGLSGLTLSAFGGSVLLRWEQPSSLDVRFGGTVLFRHSPSTDIDSVTWASSTSIGQVVKSDSLFAQLPLKGGTYLARVFDKGGRPSTEIAKANTEQTAVLAFANVASVIEHPSYNGTHDNTFPDAEDGSLKLAGDGEWDDISDFDAETNIDYANGVQLSGTYVFAGGVDVEQVQNVRITGNVDATSINVLDELDARQNDIDEWENFDGTEQSNADCRLEFRNTKDDPNASPTWSAWDKMDSAEIKARGFQFRALLSTNDPAFNIRVDELSIAVEAVP